jgi:hypothetical protein
MQPDPSGSGTAANDFANRRHAQIGRDWLTKLKARRRRATIGASERTCRGTIAAMALAERVENSTKFSGDDGRLPAVNPNGKGLRHGDRPSNVSDWRYYDRLAPAFRSSRTAARNMPIQISDVPWAKSMLALEYRCSI